MPPAQIIDLAIRNCRSSITSALVIPQTEALIVAHPAHLFAKYQHGKPPKERSNRPLYYLSQTQLPVCDNKENRRYQKHLHISCQIPSWTYAWL